MGEAARLKRWMSPKRRPQGRPARRVHSVPRLPRLHVVSTANRHGSSLSDTLIWGAARHDPQLHRLTSRAHRTPHALIGTIEAHPPVVSQSRRPADRPPADRLGIDRQTTEFSESWATEQPERLTARRVHHRRVVDASCDLWEEHQAGPPRRVQSQPALLVEDQRTDAFAVHRARSRESASRRAGRSAPARPDRKSDQHQRRPSSRRAQLRPPGRGVAAAAALPGPVLAPVSEWGGLTLARQAGTSGRVPESAPGDGTIKAIHPGRAGWPLCPAAPGDRSADASAPRHGVRTRQHPDQTRRPGCALTRRCLRRGRSSGGAAGAGRPAAVVVRELDAHAAARSRAARQRSRRGGWRPRQHPRQGRAGRRRAGTARSSRPSCHSRRPFPVCHSPASPSRSHGYSADRGRTPALAANRRPCPSTATVAIAIPT